MLHTEVPYTLYFDKSGLPLDGGSIYFGTANGNPETSPTPVFWDAAGTQPVAQPVKTIAGYPVRNGTIGDVYCATDYSVTVRDSKGQLVRYAPTSSAFAVASQVAALSTTLASGAGAAQIGYIPPSASGTVGRTVASKLQDIVALGDIPDVTAPDPTGTTTSQAAFAALLAFCQAITVDPGVGGQRPAAYIPNGEFKVDGGTLNKRQVVKGAGSGATYLKQNSGLTTNFITVNAENPGTSIYDIDHCEFSGMTWVGNKTNSTIGTSTGLHFPDAPWAITTQYSPSAILYDLRIENFTNNGIYCGANRNWLLANQCIVRYNNNWGLQIYSYDGRITSCDFGVNGVGNIVFFAGGGWTFTGTYVYGSPTNIAFSGSHNTVTDFIGCQLDIPGQYNVSIATPLIAGQPSVVRFFGGRMYNSSGGTMPDNVYPCINISAGIPATTYVAEVHLTNVKFIIDAAAHRWNYLVYTAGTKPRVIMNGCTFVSDGTNLQPFTTAPCDDVLAVDFGDTVAPIGYRKTGVGTGGTVTQLTSKGTSVSLNALSGVITMNAAALTANTVISFVLNNNYFEPNDVLLVQVQGGVASGGTYNVWANYAGPTHQAVINLRNITAGSLSEAVQIQFAIIKGVAS